MFNDTQTDILEGVPRTYTPWGFVGLFSMLAVFVGLAVNALWQILGAFKWSNGEILAIAIVLSGMSMDAIFFAFTRALESRDNLRRSFYFFVGSYMRLRGGELWLGIKAVSRFTWWVLTQIVLRIKSVFAFAASLRSNKEILAS